MSILRTDSPLEYIERVGSHHTFTPDWDDVDERCNELLDEICEKTELGFDLVQPVTFNWSDLRRPDHQDGWRLCMFLARGWVGIERDVRDMRFYVYARYPTLARRKTHGFKPKSGTGDPNIANPHRRRAVNLES